MFPAHRIQGTPFLYSRLSSMVVYTMGKNLVTQIHSGYDFNEFYFLI